MTAHRRATLSLVFGLIAAGLPALVWVYIAVTEWRTPEAFHDQGGMFISFILFPLAMLGALACGIPALVLGMGGGATQETERPRWRWVGVGLSVLGLLLALGTCIGPQMLAEALR